jgi:hypothetical protein
MRALMRGDLATRQMVGRLAACAIMAVASLPASAQPPPDGNPVPYSARSREARTAAERTAQVRCIAQATNAFANYAGPQTARENAAGAFFMSCVLKQMPNDWPLGADVHDQAGKMADAARRVDPAIDACLLTACTVEKNGDASK